MFTLILTVMINYEAVSLGSVPGFQTAELCSTAATEYQVAFKKGLDLADQNGNSQQYVITSCVKTH